MPFDNEAFRILISMLEQHRVPLLFHCATGKDRTGVAAMLILLALGASRDDVMYDYLLSNEYRKDIIARKLKENAALIKADPLALELLTMESGVSETIGNLVLDAIEERYPSTEAYLEAEFGLDTKRLSQMRAFYLEEVAEDAQASEDAQTHERTSL